MLIFLHGHTYGLFYISHCLIWFRDSWFHTPSLFYHLSPNLSSSLFLLFYSPMFEDFSIYIYTCLFSSKPGRNSYSISRTKWALRWDVGISCNTAIQDSALDYVTMEQLVAIHRKPRSPRRGARLPHSSPTRGDWTKTRCRISQHMSKSFSVNVGGRNARLPLLERWECRNRLDGHAQLNHNPKHAEMLILHRSTSGAQPSASLLTLLGTFPFQTLFIFSFIFHLVLHLAARSIFISVCACAYI